MSDLLRIAHTEAIVYVASYSLLSYFIPSGAPLPHTAAAPSVGSTACVQTRRFPVDEVACSSPSISIILLPCPPFTHCRCRCWCCRRHDIRMLMETVSVRAMGGGGTPPPRYPEAGESTPSFSSAFPRLSLLIRY
eukprot:GHVU01015967.1.p1 GENE.GHVU01015967.1~~GHVU01015967.1.p1  ORF type:complete len:135 (-),score=7.67 GHVU01015967.1:327-731(-)